MDLTTLAIAATPSFIASAVEFVEAATIVLAVGVTRGWRAPLVGTALAALTLAVIVATLGVALVNSVPEHLLKFVVGAMLTTFGIFWFGEGVGAEWPGDALSIPVILALVLAASWASVRMLNVIVPEGAHVEARNV